MGKIYPGEYRREAIELSRLGGITRAAVGRTKGCTAILGLNPKRRGQDPHPLTGCVAGLALPARVQQRRRSARTDHRTRSSPPTSFQTTSTTSKLGPTNPTDWREL